MSGAVPAADGPAVGKDSDDHDRYRHGGTGHPGMRQDDDRDRRAADPAGDGLRGAHTAPVSPHRAPAQQAEMPARTRQAERAAGWAPLACRYGIMNLVCGLIPFRIYTGPDPIIRTDITMRFDNRPDTVGR